MDPLQDPDDPELLDPAQARDLAGLIEQARLASGAVRYGRIGSVGRARVVLNSENPLPAGNHACALSGTLAEVGDTLLRLERTFVDSGRAEAVLYASPATVPEIEGVADDYGWHPVEEGVALLSRDPVERVTSVGLPEPRQVTDADLSGAARLLAEEAGLGVDESGRADEGTRKLTRHLGHRLDDPRCPLLVLDDPGADRLSGVAVGFVEHGVGLIDQVVVRPGRRRRGAGGALVTAITRTLRDRGARLVAAHAEEGGAVERFAEHCGFEAAYPVTAYIRRVDDLFD